MVITLNVVINLMNGKIKALHDTMSTLIDKPDCICISKVASY